MWFLQVTNEINPVLSYSYMAVLVPVFLLTDYLRYKPVLVLQSMSHVSIWLLLLLGTTLLEMQFMEFFYGITMAARVAYSSYIFSLVPANMYQHVASYSRSSVLLGVFTSSVTGQLCKSLSEISYGTLSAISLGFVSFGLLLSTCLPWPKQSLFFNKNHRHDDRSATQSELDRMKPDEVVTQCEKASSGACSSRKTFFSMDSVFIQMLKEIRNVVKVPSLRLWSLWWVFNSAGYYLVVFYVHILWNTLDQATDQKHVYNGGVEAASTLLGESHMICHSHHDNSPTRLGSIIDIVYYLTCFLFLLLLFFPYVQCGAHCLNRFVIILMFSVTFLQSYANT